MIKMIQSDKISTLIQKDIDSHLLHKKDGTHHAEITFSCRLREYVRLQRKLWAANEEAERQRAEKQMTGKQKAVKQKAVKQKTVEEKKLSEFISFTSELSSADAQAVLIGQYVEKNWKAQGKVLLETIQKCLTAKDGKDSVGKLTFSGLRLR